MCLNSVHKVMPVAAAICLLLLLSQMSYAQQPSSFMSVNFPARYIRHRNSLAFLDRILAQDKLGRNDATFRIVPGLAGRCNSFESVNYPGQFLRHQNYRLKLAPRSEDQLFKQDATFCIVTGLATSSGKSFESVNLPRYYLRHSNFEIWLARDDGSRTFKRDATFVVSPPLTENLPAVPID